MGSALRYFFSYQLDSLTKNGFPLGIMVVNVLGCFFIGLFGGYFDNYEMVNKQWKWLLITGFCGGFTTFSTFSHDNLKLLDSGAPFQAMLNITASITLGLVATWAGVWLTK